MESPVQEASNMDNFHQTFSLIGPENSTIEIGLDDVHHYMRYAVENCTNRGSQIGATVVVVLMLALVTKAEKRRLPVFILNMSSLLINLPRIVLQVIYFTSAWYDPFAYFSGDYSRVPRSDYAFSCATDVLTLFLTLVVEASLVLQVWAIATTTQRSYRIGIMVTCLSAALSAVALRFAITVVNIRTTLDLLDPQSRQIQVLNLAAQVSATCSIMLFATIFSVKLGYALARRHKLGLKQFGPMQILFIMSCQTMIIPAVFMILQFVGDVPELGSQALTITTLSLPLSSIWAAATIDNREQIVNSSDRCPLAQKTHHPTSSTGVSDHKSIISEGHA